MKEKINIINQFINLSNIDKARKRLEPVNYYRKYIPKCVNLTELIAKLLKKQNNFKCAKEQDEIFKIIKVMLNNRALLIQPDYAKKFILETDTSKAGLGVILA